MLKQQKKISQKQSGPGFSMTCVFFLLFNLSFGQDSLSFPYKKGRLLYSDHFEKNLNNWIVESPAATNPAIGIRNGKLAIEVTGGATVWFKRKLSGNYMIQFTRKVILAGGPRDRLSDLNMFWAATDPANKNLFTRTGVLEDYDSLSMYYVGMGGNYNSTTRFRKYQGNGERTLLQEYTDREYLLEANKEYLVQIVVNNGTTELYINGTRFFHFHDARPLTEGYFGIRTTKSHHEVDDFAVYLLR
jgi:hypothetical protein